MITAGQHKDSEQQVKELRRNKTREAKWVSPGVQR